MYYFLFVRMLALFSPQFFTKKSQRNVQQRINPSRISVSCSLLSDPHPLPLPITAAPL